MSKTLLEELEVCLKKRKPRLAQSLQPGLSEVRIRNMLKRGKVQGAIEPILSLFSWHNGTDINPTFTREEATPFPSSQYIFLDLDAMCGHLHEFKDTAVNYPNVRKVVGRYFPLFWNGSSCWVAVDLASSDGRVVIINLRAEDPVRPAYESFEAFLSDAIKAIEENRSLTSIDFR